MPLSRPSSVTIQDESGVISTVASTLNFIGAGVTASASGATTSVNIPGGGGTAGTEFYRVAANDASAASKSGADATCDGTNDEVQINTAFSSGRPVWLSEGNFNLGATLSMPTASCAKVLIGSGWNTVLNIANSTNIYAITFAPSASTWMQGAYLANFKISCNGANQTTGGGGINAFGAVWCHFQHLWIVQPYHNGIFLHEDNLGGFGHHNVIDGASFFELGEQSASGDGRAIRLEQSDENNICFNTFQDNGRVGATERNHIYDIAGLNFTHHNSFVGGGTGLKMQGPDSMADHNIFDGCKDHSIRVNGDRNKIDNNKLYHIGFTGTNLDGIWVDNVAHAQITDNHFDTIATGQAAGGTARSAINLSSGPATNSQISGNKILNTGMAYGNGTPIVKGTGTGHVIDWGGEQYVFKTADESVTSSAALQDDNHLFLPVEVNAAYRVEGFILYEGATTGDMLMGWSGPASATFDWTPGGQNNTNASIQVDRGTISTSKQVGTAGAGAANQVVALPVGYLQTGATAGTLTFRWAQGTSDATATIVLTGSHLRMRRVG